MTGQPRLSIIVPCYNEEGNVERTHAAIVEAVQPLGIPFEMVFVDDGSRDRTLEIAVGIARRDTRLTVIALRRNFGQTQAMVAGIERARGEILVTMDGDLQNDPRDIEHLLHKLAEGYDIVAGWRHDRQDRLISRRIPTRVANWLIGKVTGVPVKDTGCSLKAYRGSLIKRLPLYVDMHRFIPAMARLAGARIAEIKVRHHPRRCGASKYGLSRTYKVLLDLIAVKTIVGFAERPLLWFGMLAALPGLVGAVEIAHSMWRIGVHGRLPLPVAGSGIMFLTAAGILVLSGMLGELACKLGDRREREFWRLTATVWDAPGVVPARNPTAHG